MKRSSSEHNFFGMSLPLFTGGNGWFGYMSERTRKHYSTEEWVDFVMHQTTEAQSSAMQSHLAAGCQKCTNLASLWNRVGQVASRESSCEPPASAVEHVRQSFALLAGSRQGERKALVPRLAFDSLWQPAFPGVRSGLSSSRHVIYASGRIRIDMRLEPEPRSECVNLAGQISVPSLGTEEFPPTPVVVSGKSGNLAATTTNRFGEFHVSFVPEPGLRVSFDTVGKDQIMVPLDSTGIRGK
jgi:hypothetical protein